MSNMYYQNCIRYDGNCNRRSNGSCPENCSGYVSGENPILLATGPHLEQRPDMLTGRRNGMKKVSG